MQVERRARSEKPCCVGEDVVTEDDWSDERQVGEPSQIERIDHNWPRIALDWLPDVLGKPSAEDDHRKARHDLVRAQTHSQCRVHRPEHDPDEHRHKQCEPQVAARVSDEKPGHRAHQEHAFDSEIDDAAAFSDDGAERRQYQRRCDADGVCEREQPNVGVHDATARSTRLMTIRLRRNNSPPSANSRTAP